MDEILNLIESVSEGFLPTFELVCGRPTLIAYSFVKFGSEIYIFLNSEKKKKKRYVE